MTAQALAATAEKKRKVAQATVACASWTGACTSIAAAVLLDDQHGFLGKEQTRLRCGVCEAAIGEATATSQEAAVLFLDFTNASPRLSWRWLGFVVCRARIPDQIVFAMLFVYEDFRSLFVFRGPVRARLEMRCGVKQGSPFRGTCFALCVDGFLRAL